MPIFSKNKVADENKSEENKSKFQGSRIFLPLAPHVTEKSSAQEEHGKYVFSISPNATSGQVLEEFIARFGIRPIKINIIQARKKARRRGAFVGYKKGTKKAIITLPKDKKIDIIPK